MGHRSPADLDQALLIQPALLMHLASVLGLAEADGPEMASLLCLAGWLAIR